MYSNVLNCLKYIYQSYLSELSIYLILRTGTGSKGEGSLHICLRFPSILVLYIVRVDSVILRFFELKYSC